MSTLQDDDRRNDRNGILAKVRLDFKGDSKPGRLLFGGKPSDKAAEEAREQQVAIFKNVPLHGVEIMDIDLSTEVYTVSDELTGTTTAYAPLILTIQADSLENIIRFIAREDFRKVEILDPAYVTLSHYEIERLLFKVYEETKEYRTRLEKKYNLR
ncbi:MAG TPA: hypothetical protein PL078_03300 [Bacillota bacterium]|nr:hypothetical protein [Peptococcaceae bacterium MAG4]HPU35944.1 hypothetical protein [Bacillota bacterium]HPZ43010.1 hypothetical protein [Bacillota bacterium]HQD75539.1 hypothetical protein [Bacillota bacterium]HUM57846.1 hypothetical protein [Bacillota bacterium]